MFKMIRALFAQKTVVSTSAQIKSGYSSGRHDGSGSGQWYNG